MARELVITEEKAKQFIDRSSRFPRLSVTFLISFIWEISKQAQALLKWPSA
jgi:hypothetical protein